MSINFNCKQKASNLIIISENLKYLCLRYLPYYLYLKKNSTRQSTVKVTTNNNNNTDNRA